MIGAKPTLDYRAAADDRRHRFEHLLRRVPRFLLIVAAILCAYFFLICALGGIVFTMAAIVGTDSSLGIVAAMSLGLAVLCFLLMLFIGKAMR